MTSSTVGSDPREIATFILPGAAGIGLGVFLGLAVLESALAAGAFAVVGALGGHVAGYLLLDRS